MNFIVQDGLDNIM